MQKRIKKLTPELLKRIINEEREKIKIALKKRKKAKSLKNLKESVKKLVLLEKLQKKKIVDVQKIHAARKIIKKNILKRV